MVDAVVADPPLRQQFAAEVNTALTASTPEARTVAAEKLRHLFTHWQQVSPTMQALALQSPRLNDIGPRAEQLGELATIGLESLTYLQAHVTPSPEWKQSKLAAITEAEK